MTDRMRRMLVIVDEVVCFARLAGRYEGEAMTRGKVSSPLVDRALSAESRERARLVRALETWERQIERARAAHKRVLFRRGRKAA